MTTKHDAIRSDLWKQESENDVLKSEKRTLESNVETLQELNRKQVRQINELKILQTIKPVTKNAEPQVNPPVKAVFSQASQTRPSPQLHQESQTCAVDVKSADSQTEILEEPKVTSTSVSVKSIESSTQQFAHVMNPDAPSFSPSPEEKGSLQIASLSSEHYRPPHVRERNNGKYTWFSNSRSRRGNYGFNGQHHYDQRSTNYDWRDRKAHRQQYQYGAYGYNSRWGGRSSRRRDDERFVSMVSSAVTQVLKCFLPAF